MLDVGAETLSPVFRRVSFDDLPGWRDDPMAAAFDAFRRSARRVLAKPYRTGALGVRCAAFEPAFAEARGLPDLGNDDARAFFERHFLPCRVEPPEGRGGFVTGFYEPEIAASRVRTAAFSVPLYRRPPDLVDVDDTNRPAGMDPCFAFGRETDAGLVAYHDRGAIERGALAGRGLELAWLADRVDVFFAHVQGAARLAMTDGATVRVTYAAKSGHPFTGPGSILAAQGAIPREEVTMQSIRAWFRANPDRVDEILWQNRSFIFFRETPLGDPQKGPVAAAKVQLEPGRSLAVDRNLHTFGTPFYVSSDTLRILDGLPFRRLMIAQDTGSAIVGPARGDIFAGTGDAAGSIAGVVRHDADFYALLPGQLPER